MDLPSAACIVAQLKPKPQRLWNSNHSTLVYMLLDLLYIAALLTARTPLKYECYIRDTHHDARTRCSLHQQL